MKKEVLKSGICLITIFLVFAASSGFIFANDNLSQNSKDTTDGDIVRLSNVYVSTTGSINGNGSASSPFQTLSKAISMVDNGGTIHVANGIYNGELNRQLVIAQDMNIISDDSLPGVGMMS